MYPTNEGKFNNWTGFVFMIIMIILFNLIFSVVSIGGLASIYNLSFKEFYQIIQNPNGTAQTINIMRWFVIISTLGYLLLPSLLFSKINGISIPKMGGFSKKPNLKIVLLCISIVILAIPAAGFLEQLSHHIPFPKFLKFYAQKADLSREITFNTLLDMQQFGELFVGLFIAGIIPAFLEEIMFRGIFLNIGKGIFKNTVWKIILFQALVFAVMHFTIYQFFPILMMGAVFGIIFYYTRNLWYTIIMHFLFNSFAVIAKYISIQFFNKNGYNPGIESSNIPWYLGIASIAIIYYLIKLILKNAKDMNETTNTVLIETNDERLD